MRQTLQEVLDTWPGTATAALATKILKILDTPAPPPAAKDKPLSLTELAEREEVQKAEVRKVHQSGNQDKIILTSLTLGRERQAWEGRQVEGTAQVNRAGLGQVHLTLVLSRNGYRQYWDVQASTHDPVAAGLERGQTVRFRGTLRKDRPRWFGSPFEVECFRVMRAP